MHGGMQGNCSAKVPLECYSYESAGWKITTLYILKIKKKKKILLSFLLLTAVPSLSLNSLRQHHKSRQ